MASKKKNNKIEVSPLQTNCENFFIYSSNGEIGPANHLNEQETNKARTTIDVLALNDDDLKQSRINALDALQGITQEQAEKLAQVCMQKNEQNEYQPFCAAVFYYLKRYFYV